MRLGLFGVLGSQKAMVEVFGDLLARAGGTFKAVKPDPLTDEQKARIAARGALEQEMRSGPREPSKFHFFDRKGTYCRTTPKRDHTISARQWKKQRKAAKRKSSTV